MNDRQAVPAARWLPAFVVLAAIWGCSFLFIKVAVEQIGPVYVALGRLAIGAVTLLASLVLMRQPLPRDPRLWLHLFVVAALMNAAPFTLFAFGEQRTGPRARVHASDRARVGQNVATRVSRTDSSWTATPADIIASPRSGSQAGMTGAPSRSRRSRRASAASR